MRPSLRGLSASWLALLVLILLPGASSQAATFEVDSSADTADASPGDGLCADASGACTLRAALREANAGGSADEISLPEGNFLLPPPVFSPWSGENPIHPGDLTITGVGARRTRLNGSLEVGMCIFGCGGPTVRIRQLAIIGPADGTAIVSYGQLVLDSTLVTGSRWGVSAGGLHVERSTVRGSEIAILAGGEEPSRDLVDAESGGPVVISNSTVSGGMGIVLAWTTADIGYSTFASSDGAAISDNCNGRPGCAWIEMRGSIAAADQTDACGAEGNLGVHSLGFNLASDGSCSLDHPTDLPDLDVRLGPLQNNAGPAPTHALLAGSPAIDVIPPEDCTYDDDGDPETPELPVASDQRGVVRPQGAGCDIGAYEAVPEPSPTMLQLASLAALVGLRRRRTRP